MKDLCVWKIYVYESFNMHAWYERYYVFCPVCCMAVAMILNVWATDVFVCLCVSCMARAWLAWATGFKFVCCALYKPCPMYVGSKMHMDGGYGWMNEWIIPMILLCITWYILDDVEKIGQGQIDLENFNLPYLSNCWNLYWQWVLLQLVILWIKVKMTVKKNDLPYLSNY